MTARPDSLAQPGADAAQSCFHCGLPVPAGASYRLVLDGAAHPLCCRGCEAVAEAIVDGGLADYYRHRSGPARQGQVAPTEILERLALYDAPEVQKSFVRDLAEGEREASLILEGITCAACVWLNERHLSRLPGVTGVAVNYTTHRARVRWDSRVAKLSDILQAVQAIGYTAHPYDPDRQDALRRLERRRAIRRLAIAGLSAMQVMMYAVPAYLADPGTMTPDIEALMRFASLLLTLPVMLYAAVPFFRGALSDLRARRAGMDVPVALGILVAFTASVHATVYGGDVYYDSISMFVFFLLAGRFLEQGARARAGDAAEKLVRLIPAFAHRVEGGAEVEVPVSALAAGDLLRVRPGESVPADGLVAEGRSEADESLLTGESRPVPKAAGDALTGGSVNLASPLLMRVTRVGEDTVLASVVRLLDRALAEKPALAQLADRVAAWFVLGLILVTLAVALAWWTVDPSRVLPVSIALLVATCPCALSLATPAALAAATGRLTDLGLLVTRGHGVETLARATDFVFDKTGTLTTGRMSLSEVVPLWGFDRKLALSLAAALERGSEHPLARAILAGAARADAEPLAAEGLVALPGSGVEALVEGVRYRLGRPDYVAGLSNTALPHQLAWLEQGATVLALGDETGTLALFLVTDEPRPEAREALRRLETRGARVHLLSGDRPGAVRAMAERLGIRDWAAEQSPAGKLDYVDRLQAEGAVVAMVGDGVNDAPVLARAQVSVAMGEGTEVAQASADMVLMARSLSRLVDGVEVAARTRRVIHQNLAWAVAYNALAVPAAALGHVTPWLAGLGMSLSSLAVVLNALRLRR